MKIYHDLPFSHEKVFSSAHINYFHRGFHTWNQNLERVVATAVEWVSELPTSDPSYNTPKTHATPTGITHWSLEDLNEILDK